jgi:Rad3-related DNA helicase
MSPPIGLTTSILSGGDAKKMYLPDPKSLGLPPKFPDWRPQQEEAILRLFDSPKRFFVPVLPTGAGKGLFYVGYALLAAKRTAFLTITKGLQTQNMDDFRSIGMVDLRGQNAYECIHPKVPPGLVMADEGPCHSGCACDYKDSGCYYYDDQALAANPKTRFVQTNYKKWIMDRKFSHTLRAFEVLVLDEAHDAVEALSGHLQVELTRNDMRDLGISDLPKCKNFEEWRAHSKEWELLATTIITGMENSIQIQQHRADGKIDTQLLKDIRRMKSLRWKLERLSMAKGTWVPEEVSRKGSWGVPTARFEPLWPSEYAEELLFSNIPKIILTSATINQKTLGLLGIKSEDVDYQEFPSTFPKSNRPVYILRNVPRVDHKMAAEDRDLWMDKIHSVVRPRLPLGRKGIIHPVSYDRGKWFADRSKYSQNILLHTKNITVEKIVEQFRKSPPGTILVSPSVKTGFDFWGDQCRYQILIKVPFQDTRDNLVLQEREKTDKDYAYHMVCQTIEQATGRSTRSPEDWSEVFLIDGHFYWIYPKYKGEYMHKWFIEAVQYVEVAPDPLFQNLKGEKQYGIR